MATIPILWKREDWVQHLSKLSEEFTELAHELHDMDEGKGNIGRTVSEALDVIQVAIGIIDASGVDYSEAIREHAEKLQSRGWSIKGWIDVDVTMGVRDE